MSERISEYDKLKKDFKEIIKQHVKQAIEQAKNKWVEKIRPEMTFEEFFKTLVFSEDLERFYQNHKTFIAYTLRNIADEIKSRPTRKA